MIAEALEASDHDYEPRRMPAQPTMARPGSSKKVKVLQAQFLRNKHLYHANDFTIPLIRGNWFADRRMSDETQPGGESAMVVESPAEAGIAESAAPAELPATTTQPPETRVDASPVASAAAAADAELDKLEHNDLLQAVLKVSEDRETAIKEIDAKLNDLRTMMARLQLARRMLLGVKRRAKTQREQYRAIEHKLVKHIQQYGVETPAALGNKLDIEPGMVGLVVSWSNRLTKIAGKVCVLR